ncbi:MAG: prolipoprotein diacylglyceryl transferase [Bacteroidales bacterium]|nr:prolipoprotein diacylglyceryl transferase [Bacteroidales bacterium]
MNPHLLYIIWEPSKDLVSVGSFTIHWYGALWCIGLVAAYFVMLWLYRRQKMPAGTFEPLFYYCFIGILLGARLGHCLLYEPGYFLSHPIEMLLPIRETAEGWRCTGYAGLASHGGTLGLMIALWLYVKKTKVNLLRVLDNIAIATPIAACCIRLGNLMNSEIVGKYTGTEFGFVFAANGDVLPRYPAQLFEAVAYFVFFFVGLWLYRRYRTKVGTGMFFGWCLTAIFTFRFLVEFIKEVQESWEVSMVGTIGLNQGQLLSIPFIIIGVYCLVGGKLCKKWGEKTDR